MTPGMVMFLIWLAAVGGLAVMGTQKTMSCGAIGVSTDRPCENNAPGLGKRCTRVRAHKGRPAASDKVALKFYAAAVALFAVGALITWAWTSRP
jgi:hypothetical protein